MWLIDYPHYNYNYYNVIVVSYPASLPPFKVRLLWEILVEWKLECNWTIHSCSFLWFFSFSIVNAKAKWMEGPPTCSWLSVAGTLYIITHDQLYNLHTCIGIHRSVFKFKVSLITSCTTYPKKKIVGGTIWVYFICRIQFWPIGYIWGQALRLCRGMLSWANPTIEILS